MSILVLWCHPETFKPTTEFTSNDVFTSHVWTHAQILPGLKGTGGKLVCEARHV